MDVKFENQGTKLTGVFRSPEGRRSATACTRRWRSWTGRGRPSATAGTTRPRCWPGPGSPAWPGTSRAVATRTATGATRASRTGLPRRSPPWPAWPPRGRRPGPDRPARRQPGRLGRPAGGLALPGRRGRDQSVRGRGEPVRAGGLPGRAHAPARRRGQGQIPRPCPSSTAGRPGRAAATISRRRWRAVAHGKPPGTPPLVMMVWSSTWRSWPGSTMTTWSWPSSGSRCPVLAIWGEWRSHAPVAASAL